MAVESGNSLSVTRAYDRATGALTAALLDGPSGLRQDAVYGYDDYGNLISRADDLASRGESETYSYDSFDRLAIATADIPTIGTITTASAYYTQGGDLQSRSDAAGSLSYSYAAGGAPHRLTDVSGELNATLGYDAAGRMTAAGPLTVTYNARGLAKDIQRRGHESTVAYDPSGQEYRETIDGTKTITLIAGGAFRVEQAGGVTTYRQALVVNGAVVGQVVSTSADGTPHYQYFATDNIGSVTEVVSGSGAEIAAFAYDPFGRRRKAVDWNAILPIATLQTLDAPTRRGYTGGEMLDETGYVLLGARVYSPELGRWLSPDPAGLGSPYVYVGNNPESDTDPTGAISTLQIVEIAALVAVSVVTGGAASPLLLAEIGAIEGFATGFIASGGNFRAGLIGAAGGAAFGAIGGAFPGSGLAVSMERAGLEGFVGGALTEANGGRFSDGFLGAFAASAAGGAIDSRIMPNNGSAGAIAARTAAAAALGGTVSKINGGNFANGAWSAAFQHLFNERLHPKPPPELRVDQLKPGDVLLTGSEQGARYLKYVGGAPGEPYGHAALVVSSKGEVVVVFSADPKRGVYEASNTDPSVGGRHWMVFRPKNVDPHALTQYIENSRMYGGFSQYFGDNGANVCSSVVGEALEASGAGWVAPAGQALITPGDLGQALGPPIGKIYIPLEKGN